MVLQNMQNKPGSLQPCTLASADRYLSMCFEQFKTEVSRSRTSGNNGEPINKPQNPEDEMAKGGLGKRKQVAFLESSESESDASSESELRFQVKQQPDSSSG